MALHDIIQRHPHVGVMNKKKFYKRHNVQKEDGIKMKLQEEKIVLRTEEKRS